MISDKTKSIMQHLLLLLSLFLLSISCFAQLTDQVTYDLKFDEIQCTPTSFCFEIQVKGAAGEGDFVIGSYTIALTYNTDAIRQPTYNPINFYNTTQDGGTAQECEIVAGIVYAPFELTSNSYSETVNPATWNVTSLLDTYFDGYECPVVDDTTWMPFGQVCFDIIDPNEEVNISFDTGLTILNKSDDTPSHIPGILSTIDNTPKDYACAPTCLPVSIIINN